MKHAHLNRRHQSLTCERLEDRRLLAVTMNPLGTFHSGVFDESAAEITAHDPATQRLYVTNVDAAGVDILDINDPTDPVRVGTIDTSVFGEEPTSVSVHNGLLAVAVRNDKDNPMEGSVALLDVTGSPSLINVVTAGFGPDMLTFTPDGSKVLVANQGRPSENYEHDPEGSISIIDVSAGAASATVVTADFTQFDGREDELRDAGVRIFGPIVQNGVIVGEAPAAHDLEPEFIAVSPDSTQAWVTLQENNAVGVLDIESATFVDIKGLGYKNHRASGNGLDASDRDGGINIERWRVKGMYQPDAIATYVSAGELFLVTANEGNERDNDEGPFNEESRLKDVNVVRGLQHLQANEKLGRLSITTEPPQGKRINQDDEVVLNQIYAFGTRSFSIWSDNADLVYDSGDDFEQITAARFPEHFNANDGNDFDDGTPDNLDSRSDNKGPEPEAVVVGEIDGRSIAFVGLERIGGVMIYDVTDPHAPIFQSYVNNRNFNEPNTIMVSQTPPVFDPVTGDEILVKITNPAIGDLAVEGMVFISANDSPNGNPLLVTSNEVSGTTTVFEITSEGVAAAAARPAAPLGTVAASLAEVSTVKRDSDTDDVLVSAKPKNETTRKALSMDLQPANNSAWQRSADQFFEQLSARDSEVGDNIDWEFGSHLGSVFGGLSSTLQ